MYKRQQHIAHRRFFLFARIYGNAFGAMIPALLEACNYFRIVPY